MRKLMKKITLAGTMVLATLTTPLITSLPAWAGDWNSLIERLDSNRVFARNGQIMTLKLQSFKDGKPNTAESLRVYTHVDNRQTVALFLDTKRKGQKMLMRDNNFWMIMPKSSRPVRISAVQRVMGEASSGDIASLSYVQDYTVQSGVDKGDTATLTLMAKHKGVTYAKAILVVDKKRGIPLSGDYYLKSGKHSKSVAFTYRADGDKWRTQTVTLTDIIRKNRKTVMTYSDEQAKPLPARLFNAKYLVSGGKLPS